MNVSSYYSALTPANSCTIWMSSRHRALLQSAMTSSFCLRIKTAYLILISPRFLKSGDWCTGCDFWLRNWYKFIMGVPFYSFSLITCIKEIITLHKLKMKIDITLFLMIHCHRGEKNIISSLLKNLQEVLTYGLD